MHIKYSLLLLTTAYHNISAVLDCMSTTITKCVKYIVKYGLPFFPFICKKHAIINFFLEDSDMGIQFYMKY